MSIQIPRYIALCGHPGAGKTEVQKILAEHFGVAPVDDGLPLRTIAVEQMGLTWEQVLTQEGKKQTVTVAGKEWIVRDLLGQLGNRIEDLLGPHGIPFLSEMRLKDKDGAFSLGSVRRDQGRFWIERGAVVIGIRNPLAKPSPYEFDRFDASLVDVWIDNDFLAAGLPPEKAREELQHAVWAALKTLDLHRGLFRDSIVWRAL